MKPLLLDVCSCAGGASMGYHRAGFDVTGVDIAPQPRYPFTFHQTDGLQYLADHGHEYDAIHVSPPCQAYSVTRSLHTTKYEALIGPFRDLLEQIGRPYVIENVPGSDLRSPLMLCGTEFGLKSSTGWWLRRHRLFESNVDLWGAGGCNCTGRRTAHVTGHLPAKTYAGRSGNQMGRLEAQEAMGIDWMTNAELVEAIPPAFTEFIGSQLIDVLTEAAA